MSYVKDFEARYIENSNEEGALEVRFEDCITFSHQPFEDTFVDGPGRRANQLGTLLSCHILLHELLSDLHLWL